MENEYVSLEQKKINNKEKVIFKNDNIEITDVDIEKQIVGLSTNTSNSKETVAVSAVENALEKNCMFAIAEQLGYSTSDEEYQEYVSAIKSASANADNKDAMNSFYDGFGGIDAYFQIMEGSLRESLAIREYLDDLMLEFVKETNQEIMDADSAIMWSEKENQIKKESISQFNISQSDIDAMVVIAENMIP